MAMSLPENTVDAWTAIHLAAVGASWIWLPTTNQGATAYGPHPGDISSVLGRRLVVIESKGIRDAAGIPFGSDGAFQRQHLRSVEEVGLGVLAARGISRPPLGWVLYGLPLMPGPVCGTGWGDFPSWHYLACPHDLDAGGVGQTSVALRKLAAVLYGSKSTDHQSRPMRQLPRRVMPLRLDVLAAAIENELVGMPLPANASEATTLLVQLCRQLPSIAEGDGREPSEDDDLSVLGLLGRLSGVVRAKHTTVAVI